jgi:hypothetical protein
MSRFKRLKYWPDCLKRYSLEELRRELHYWQGRFPFLGHPAAKKECAKRARLIAKEIDLRESPAEPGDP